MVIGLSNNGNLYGAIDDAMQNYIKGEYDSILAQFKNVLRFDFSVDISLDSTFAEALNIVAITKDNTIVSYVNGVFSEKEIDNAVGVMMIETYEEYEVYYLNTDGKVVNIDTNKCILEDIVYTNNEFCITRNGSVYLVYHPDEKTESYKENAKVVVYDEWIERLN